MASCLVESIEFRSIGKEGKKEGRKAKNGARSVCRRRGHLRQSVLLPKPPSPLHPLHPLVLYMLFSCSSSVSSDVPFEQLV